MRLCTFYGSSLSCARVRANRSSHVVYTIPVAILLTILLKPLCTRLDQCKIVFLVTVAFTYTIPWYEMSTQYEDGHADNVQGLVLDQIWHLE
jgi:hypothetical protein